MIYNATIGLKSKNNISYAFRERSILALGAIAVGSYEYLKPHLNMELLRKGNVPLETLGKL